MESMLELAQRSQELAERSERQIARLKTRIERLEEELRRTRATAPSRPPPIRPRPARSAAPRRGPRPRSCCGAIARSARRALSPGTRARVASSSPQTKSMRSSTTSPSPAGAAGTGSARRSAPPPRFGRHQVAELPEVAVRLTEHRTHRLRCPRCRARRRRAARRAHGLGLRPPRPGGGGDDERPQPHLAPRHGRAGR